MEQCGTADVAGVRKRTNALGSEASAERGGRCVAEGEGEAAVCGCGGVCGSLSVVEGVVVRGEVRTAVWWRSGRRRWVGHGARCARAAGALAQLCCASACVPHALQRLRCSVL